MKLITCKPKNGHWQNAFSEIVRKMKTSTNVPKGVRRPGRSSLRGALSYDF
jgi:hypothetical protein